MPRNKIYMQAAQAKHRAKDPLAYNARARNRRARRLAHYREVERARQMRNRYGLSKDQYMQLLADQCWSCAICNSTVPLLVDHNHRTGQVRGLLCRTCNSALGMLRDEAVLASKAADYLKRFDAGEMALLNNSPVPILDEEEEEREDD